MDAHRYAVLCEVELSTKKERNSSLPSGKVLRVSKVNFLFLSWFIIVVVRIVGCMVAMVGRVEKDELVWAWKEPIVVQ